MTGSLIAGGIKLLSGESGKSKANKLAGSIVPKNIRTGNSSFNTRTGVASIDRSIRDSQNNFTRSIRELIPQANEAFTSAGDDLESLRGEFAGLRSRFEGNQSEFREAQLAPLRESIAGRTGELNRELSRTNVRGTFANQARTGLALDSARELRRAEAEIENNSINQLGDFLQIDADLIKSGLGTETGRIGILSELENTLASVGSERFNQELALLGLPGQFIQGNVESAKIRGNAEGIQLENIADFAGDVLDIFS